MDASLWIVPELISCHSQRLASPSSALPVENLLFVIDKWMRGYSEPSASI
jgi:hypothetical protein